MENEKKKLLKNLNKSIKSDIKLLTGRKTKGPFELTEGENPNKSLSFIFQEKEERREQEDSTNTLLFRTNNYEYVYGNYYTLSNRALILLLIGVYFLGRYFSLYLFTPLIGFLLLLIQFNFTGRYWERESTNTTMSMLVRLGLLKINSHTGQKILSRGRKISSNNSYINSLIQLFWLKYESLISLQITNLLNENLSLISPRFSILKFSIGKQPVQFDLLETDLKNNLLKFNVDLSMNKENQENNFIVELGYRVGNLNIPFRLSDISFDLSIEFAVKMKDLLNLIGGRNLADYSEVEEVKQVYMPSSLGAHFRSIYPFNENIEPCMSVYFKILRLPNFSFNLVPLNMGNIMNFFQLKRILNFSLQKIYKNLNDEPIKINLFSKEGTFKADRLVNEKFNNDYAKIKKPEILRIKIHTFMQKIKAVQVVLLRRADNFKSRPPMKNKLCTKLYDNIARPYADDYISRHAFVEGEEITKTFSLNCATFDDLLIIFYDENGYFANGIVRRTMFEVKNLDLPIYKCNKLHAVANNSREVEFIRKYYEYGSNFTGFCCSKIGLINVELCINLPKKLHNFGILHNFFNKKTEVKKSKMLIKKINTTETEIMQFKTGRKPTAKIFAFDIITNVKGKFYVAPNGVQLKKNTKNKKLNLLLNSSNRNSKFDSLENYAISKHNEILSKNYAIENLIFYNLDREIFTDCSSKNCYCTGKFIDNKKSYNFNHKFIPLKILKKLQRKKITLFNFLEIQNLKIYSTDRKIKMHKIYAVAKLNFLPEKLENDQYRFILKTGRFTHYSNVDGNLYANQLLYVPIFNKKYFECKISVFRNEIFYGSKNIKFKLEKQIIKEEKKSEKQIIENLEEPLAVHTSDILQEGNEIGDLSEEKSNNYAHDEKINLKNDNKNNASFTTKEDYTVGSFENLLDNKKSTSSFRPIKIEESDSSSKINFNISDIIKTNRSNTSINISDSALNMIKDRNEVSEIELPINFDRKNESKEFGFFTEEIAEETSTDTENKIEGTNIETRQIKIKTINCTSLVLNWEFDWESVNSENNLNHSKLYAIHTVPLNIPYPLHIEFLQNNEIIKYSELKNEIHYIFSKNDLILINIFLLYKNEKIHFMRSALPQENKNYLIFSLENSHPRIAKLNFTQGTYKVYFKVQHYDLPYYHLPIKRVGQLSLSLIGLYNLRNFHQSICRTCDNYEQTHETVSYKYFTVYLNNSRIYTSNSFDSMNIMLDLLLLIDVQVYDKIKIVIFENKNEFSVECKEKRGKKFTFDRLIANNSLEKKKIFSGLIDFYGENRIPIYFFDFSIFEIFENFREYKRNLFDIYRRESTAYLKVGLKFN